MKKESYAKGLVSILRSHLSRGQYLTLKITTNSMRPLIDPGDLIVVSPYEFNRLKRGDMVLYSQGGNFFCHRVMDKGTKNETQFLVIKGDSEFYLGESLDFMYVLGRVSKIKKKKFTIDCNVSSWRIVNLFLGEISFLGGRILGRLRRFKRKIFGSNKFLLVPLIKYIIYMPFYLSIRLFGFILRTEKDLGSSREAENKLIDLCSQIGLETQGFRDLKDSLRKDLDWGYILERADREGLHGLLYNNLHRFRQLLPEDAIDKLRSRHIDYGARNLILLNELKQLSYTFREEMIQFIVLKGLGLLNTIYPNITLRPITDIDILIREKDYPTVKRLLERLGYRSSCVYPEDFVKDDIVIDVHWFFVNYTRIPSRKSLARIDLEEVFHDAVAMNYNGDKFLTLCLEDLLIHLSLHYLYHHGLRRSIFLVDIQELLKGCVDEIDWNKFEAKVKRYRVEKSIFYVLTYMNKLKVEIPQGLLKELQNIKIGWLGSKFIAKAINSNEVSYLRFFLTFLTIKGLYYKLSFLRETFLPRPKVLRTLYAKYSAIPEIFLYFQHLARVGCLFTKASLKVKPLPCLNK